ncbi:MAG: hypothetical protein PHD31_03115 [Candidatus Pacebacteria bacterium]|nr:hypothetical protein [Candidatus Paceibacterota bacterium]
MFKKVFALIAIMFFLATPMLVLAVVDCTKFETVDECPATCTWSGGACIASSTTPSVDLKDCTKDAVCNAIIKIKGYVEMVGAVVIGMMIVIAGLLYATGGGNEKQMSTAKSMITAAVVGMIILLSAEIITTTVKTLLGWGS